MKIDYPTEEEIRRQCQQILDTAMPDKLGFIEKIRKIYWEPGPGVIFYQCGIAWLITGMIYLMISLACLLSREHIKRQLFFSLLCSPVLYMVFFLVSFYSEEQTAVIELKHTLHHSFTRLASLRMFYSSILLIFSNLVLLWELQIHPSLRSCSLRELWATTVAGTSSMFLFALFSLYLYHRLGNCRHVGVLLVIWILACAGLLLPEDRISLYLLRDIPLAIHLAVAACTMALFIIYVTRMSIMPLYPWKRITVSTDH